MDQDIFKIIEALQCNGLHTLTLLLVTNTLRILIQSNLHNFLLDKFGDFQSKLSPTHCNKYTILALFYAECVIFCTSVGPCWERFRSPPPSYPLVKIMNVWQLNVCGKFYIQTRIKYTYKRSNYSGLELNQSNF